MAKLSNVEELCIAMPHSGPYCKDRTLKDESFRSLLKEEMPRLKRLNFSLTDINFSAREQGREGDPMILWLRKMLMTVEYFCVELHSSTKLVDTVRTLICPAVGASSVEDRVLKVRFNCKSAYTAFEEITEFVESAKNVMEIMDRKCSDWAFIVHGLGIRKSSATHLREALVPLRELSGCNVYMNWESGHISWADIVLRGGAMSRIQEPWIMNCAKCPRQTQIYQ